MDRYWRAAAKMGAATGEQPKIKHLFNHKKRKKKTYAYF
jgi:hypothetical protein